MQTFKYTLVHLTCLVAMIAILVGANLAHVEAAHRTDAHPAVHAIGPTFVTGYDLLGPTRSGWPAGPGVCAVDPSVIPLGATIHIPGVGICRARDTGGMIIGRHVDVWFRTYQACLQVTGTYYGVTWWISGAP